MAGNNPRAYKQKAEKVRRILSGALTVEVEHLPIERYGPNLHIIGIEQAVTEILLAFGFNKPTTTDTDITERG